MVREEEKINIRGVLYYEDGEWIAQGLEVDITGCGDTPEEAVEDFDGALETYIEFCFKENRPIQMAPKKFFDMWEESHKAVVNDFFANKSSRGKSKSPVTKGNRIAESIERSIASSSRGGIKVLA